jgi:small basic protein
MRELFFQVWNHLLRLSGTWGGWLFAFVYATAVTWWGAAPEALQNLAITGFCLLAVDTFLKGVVALRDREFSPDKIVNAFVKFFTYTAAVGVAAALDFGLSLGYTAVMIVLGLMVWREGTSCLDHLEELGLPIPGLREFVNRFKKKEDE